jgi:hypothetical protein
MADRIFRSGSPVSVNMREAQDAVRKKDNIRKMKISATESDEVPYFPALRGGSDFHPGQGIPVRPAKKLILLIQKLWHSQGNCCRNKYSPIVDFQYCQIFKTAL